MYRRHPLLSVVILFLLYSASATAQIKPVSNTNKTVNDASNSVNSATQTIGTATNTINQLKTIFGQKKNKSKEAVTIGIAGIEYEDDNLTLLHEAIEKVSGVKDAKKSMKNGAITIEVIYKKGADELWDHIPKDKKSLFKISETADNNIILIYKNAKQGNATHEEFTTENIKEDSSTTTAENNPTPLVNTTKTTTKTAPVKQEPKKK